MSIVVTLGPHLATIRHRIAIGLVCVDAVNDRPVPAAMTARLLRLGTTFLDLPFDEHGAGHFALRFAGKLEAIWRRKIENGLSTTLDIRVSESPRPGPKGAPAAYPLQYIGRRFTLELARDAVPAPNTKPIPTVDNVFRVPLWRGPAAGVPTGLTVLRGRCVYTPAVDGVPVPYARVFATTPPAEANGDIADVRGAAFCDARGDYVMILGGGLLAPAVQTMVTRVRLTARGYPMATPAAGDEYPRNNDFWNLPIETQTAALAPPADILKRLPASFTKNADAGTPDRTVEIRVGAEHSGPEFDLTFPVP